MVLLIVPPALCCDFCMCKQILFCKYLSCFFCTHSHLHARSSPIVCAVLGPFTSIPVDDATFRPGFWRCDSRFFVEGWKWAQGHRAPSPIRRGMLLQFVIWFGFLDSNACLHQLMHQAWNTLGHTQHVYATILDHTNTRLFTGSDDYRMISVNSMCCIFTRSLALRCVSPQLSSVGM